jgi:hypothetical protein
VRGAFGLKNDPAKQGALLAEVSGGSSIELQLHLSPAELAMVDDWIARHSEPKLSRIDAIHRLLGCALIEHRGQ